MYAELQIMYAY